MIGLLVLSEVKISDPGRTKGYKLARGLAYDFDRVWIFGVATNCLRTSPKVDQKPVIYLEEHDTNHLGTYSSDLN